MTKLTKLPTLEHTHRYDSWENLTASIGERTVNLGEEIERLSDEIATVCLLKRKQQRGEAVDVEGWVLRLRCPEDVIPRMLKMNKIKTTMDADASVVDGFLSRVRVVAMRKYLEGCYR